MNRPKTIQVKKPVNQPGEVLMASSPSTAEAVSEAKKSETARIDLPPEGSDRPATRPKTIRIKRPDGTSGRKPLMIARPSEGPSSGVSMTPTFSDSADLAEEGPGSVFATLALVALLVTCVGLYVLAAQTIAPSLPFPGRLG